VQVLRNQTFIFYFYWCFDISNRTREQETSRLRFRCVRLDCQTSWNS